MVCFLCLSILDDGVNCVAWLLLFKLFDSYHTVYIDLIQQLSCLTEQDLQGDTMEVIMEEGSLTITMGDTTTIITGESAIGGDPTTDMGMQSVSCQYQCITLDMCVWYTYLGA